ncbi:MAG: hypothetical protein ACI9UJ_000004 [bacterium]|jgi:hypothetical protein
MRKTNWVGAAVLVSFVLVVLGCNKKTDPREMVYKTWAIEQVEMEGDKVGQDAVIATNTIEFTKKGVIKLTEGSEVTTGTFKTNETATSMITIMGGSVDTFVISGLTESHMILGQGDDKMELKVK